MVSNVKLTHLDANIIGVKLSYYVDVNAKQAVTC